MTYVQIILAAAKAARVSGELLLAICTHETNLTSIVVNHDGGSPSYGMCQVKYDTARMLGYKGKPANLVNPVINAYYAASYLKYQENRPGYGADDWCKLAAAYNAGSFIESKKVPGKPANLKYVRKVQKKLDEALRDKLSCETDMAEK